MPYAKVRFPQQNGLSKTYDYSISPDLATQVSAGDYVVIQSARSDYAVGVMHSVVDAVDDPSIVTKSVVQKVDVPKHVECTLETISLGGK